MKSSLSSCRWENAAGCPGPCIVAEAARDVASNIASFEKRLAGSRGRWRRGWDSNPRYGFPYARFRGEYFQPLSHLSAVVADLIVAERCVFRQSGRGLYANALPSIELSLCNAAGRGAARKSRMRRLKPLLLAACSE